METTYSDAVVVRSSRMLHSEHKVPFYLVLRHRDAVSRATQFSLDPSIYARSHQIFRVVGPVQQGLALARTARRVSWLAVPLNLRNMSPHSLLSAALARVLFRHAALGEAEFVTIRVGLRWKKRSPPSASRGARQRSRSHGGRPSCKR